MISDAFDAGIVSGMEKQAGMRTGMLSLGSRATRRMGGGTGRFSSLMDRLSTRMTKRRQELQSVAKAKRTTKQDIRNLKQQFRERAGEMAPAKREKARQKLQADIAARKQQLGTQRQEIQQRYRPAPTPTPDAAAAAKPSGGAKPEAKPEAGGKKPWYKTTGGMVGLGAGGLAAAGGLGYAATRGGGGGGAPMGAARSPTTVTVH